MTQQTDTNNAPVTMKDVRRFILDNLDTSDRKHLLRIERETLRRVHAPSDTGLPICHEGSFWEIVNEVFGRTWYLLE